MNGQLTPTQRVEAFRDKCAHRSAHNIADSLADDLGEAIRLLENHATELEAAQKEINRLTRVGQIVLDDVHKAGQRITALEADKARLGDNILCLKQHAHNLPPYIVNMLDEMIAAMTAQKEGK